MRVLAAALLSEACSRTGARLSNARSLEAGLPQEDALRAATVEGRRLLLAVAAQDESEPRPSPLELLKALAAVESAAQELLMEAADVSPEGEAARMARAAARAKVDAPVATGTRAEAPEPAAAKQGRRSVTFGDAAGDSGSSVAHASASSSAQPAAAAAAAAPAIASASHPWPQRRWSFRRAARDFLSNASGSLLGSTHTPEDSLVDSGLYGSNLDECLIQSWCSADPDSMLFKTDDEMLEQLARDAIILTQASQTVSELVAAGSEGIELINEQSLQTAANVDATVHALVDATQGRAKRRGYKTAVTMTAAGVVVGFAGGAPLVLALGAGAVNKMVEERRKVS